MHDHSPGIRGAAPRRLLAISLTLTGVVMVVQIVGGVLSGSLALLADAAHMFTDAAALVIALVASTVALRPANDRRTFGYQRAEVLGALVNAVILIVLAVWVAVGAVLRLMSTRVEVAGPLMLVVAAVGLCANAVSMWLLSHAQRRSINVRGAYLEVLGDLLGSVAVLIAAVVIIVTGWTAADAVASLLIAVMIVPRAVGLLREVASVLTESVPRGMHVQAIRDHILTTPGVRDVHDVHVWQLTRGAPVFSAHVVVDDEAQAGDILTRLQTCLSQHFDVEHSTFQLEPAGHAEPGPHA